MIVLSQDGTISVPFEDYIFKVIHTSELDQDMTIEDAVKPWAIVVMYDDEACELMGKYETKEQAKGVLYNLIEACYDEIKISLK